MTSISMLMWYVNEKSNFNDITSQVQHICFSTCLSFVIIIEVINESAYSKTQSHILLSSLVSYGTALQSAYWLLIFLFFFFCFLTFVLFEIWLIWLASICSASLFFSNQPPPSSFLTNHFPLFDSYSCSRFLYPCVFFCAWVVRSSNNRIWYVTTQCLQNKLTKDKNAFDKSNHGKVSNVNSNINIE